MSKLLIDTHILIWLLTRPDVLPHHLVQQLADRENIVSVSLVSLWEIAIKKSIGKLEVPTNINSYVEKSGFEIMPISLRHISEIENLPLHHRDPFDRMLISQAKCENQILVTDDKLIELYDISIIKAV